MQDNPFRQWCPEGDSPICFVWGIQMGTGTEYTEFQNKALWANLG